MIQDVAIVTMERQ